MDMRSPAQRGGLLLAFLMTGVLAGCLGELSSDPPAPPAAPEGLEARYYNRAVLISWELAPGWDEESFRIYGKRAGQPQYLFLAEVTSCSGGRCSYSDRNIVAGQSYTYYVAAWNSSTGQETASAFAVDVAVPQPVPPPVPAGLKGVALDGAAYVRWSANARDVSDFSFYRLYLSGSGGEVLLGETDSEGFLDLLARNGTTYRYRVSSVDDQGHESAFGTEVAVTPRPDYHSEILYAFEDRPARSGFRFPEEEATVPIVSGLSPSRHVRLEVDADGWWLVPGPGVQLYPEGFETTALVCGPGADADCEALTTAPGSGYVTRDVFLTSQTTYALRYPSGQGFRYGAIRVTMQGFDQGGDALMVFGWVHQLQVGNPNLAPVHITGSKVR